ncbi:hypothetical protein [Streptomyces sp. NPDC058240]|uniref:hypothetical protein n=1 Tax=Streptomyces sp. NPDC058240 TaxID=3346396 RepID=UPI0036EDE3D8
MRRIRGPAVRVLAAGGREGVDRAEQGELSPVRRHSRLPAQDPAEVHQVATGTGKDFILVLTAGDEPYDPLIKG